MPVMASSQKHAWWSELRHSGLVVAPALLEEYFPDGPDEPKWFSYRNLRERYAAFDAWCQGERAYQQGTDHRPLYAWLDGVLDTFLGHEGSRWQKGSNVAAQWKHDTMLGERLSPQRILFRDSSQREPALFVWVEVTRQLGQGGRAGYGRLLELLRAKNVKLGLMTNGRQFRLCYAGLDYDSWAEWDAESWFVEEELRHQLYGFYTLLGPSGMNPRTPGAQSFPLLEAAEASRSRQGELSAVLGEQVRESIELLLNELNRAVRQRPELLAIVRSSPQGGALAQKRLMEALYQATVRIIMRLVIILFAEARDLLPRSLATYNDSYGLEGLYEQLRRARQDEGHRALEEHYSAWPRLLSLFSLIYYGSSSPTLPVQEYGGLLFRPGEPESQDAALRAISLFESPDIAISDATVLRLLELLKNGRLKIRQGSHSRWVNGPVDFSELRTEYIGLMYQGLLDFNLHTTTEPMVFLNLGQEPVLPLKLLEEMSDQHLKDLLKKLRVEKSSVPAASEEEASAGEDEENEDAAEEIEEEPVAEGAEVEDEVIEDEGDEAEEEEDEAGTLSEADLRRQRALRWAERAVEVAGLLKTRKPEERQKDALYLYEQEREREARRLIKRALDQDEFYLVRRGGTRKGSGTFYTRPQLAVPIAQRTLEPLLYTVGEDGARLPRTPEEILALKVCDPACGSASFLVAALHYITDALYQSLVYYRRINAIPDENGVYIRITLPFGEPSRARPEEELLPVRADDERLEPMTKARLRRYVVERCLYGVDLSPLAVELARMSLWIETMDRDLPFTFLDHKIKVGNSLVGAWFDTFREYPVMAWLRDGGDARHTNGVRYKPNEWTNAIKQTRNDVIKPEIVEQIRASLPQLFPEDVQQTPEGIHDQMTNEMEQIHRMPIESIREREERYRAMQDRTEYQEMKRAFDRWCAAWFWPGDELACAPTPRNFYNPSARTREIVDELANELHFFHWEIEFPEVFARREHGFDAVLANPPWEISKPVSLEFFSDYDPLYRAYGKQEALREQRHLFELDAGIEREWLLYQAYFRGMSNWVGRAASPFGDPIVPDMESFTILRGKKGAELHKLWRQRRSKYQSYCDGAEPFRYQGAADLNTYKLFLEVAHHCLKTGGRLGMLVPSGLYTDRGSAELRRLFLDHCRWLWLFGFINHRRIFSIHSAFKFVALLLEKGGRTDTLRVTFNQEQLEQLEQPEPVLLDFPREQVERFSPRSLAIIEAQTARDLAILEKLYSNTVLLGDQHAGSWQIQYATEFHMTNDSRLFPPLPQWQARGYRPDGYGRWRDDDGNIALPLYEGRMIGAFDPSKKGWVSGKGRGAVWRDIPFDDKVIQPQYLVAYKDSQERIGKPGSSKISFMSIGSATNARSMYASVVDNLPCGHSLAIIKITSLRFSDIIALAGVLNSFTYDYAMRNRLGGLNLSYFVLAETPLIPPARLLPTPCARLAARLNLIMPCFAPQWLELRAAYPELEWQHWRQLWAITSHERLRLRCILDAMIAELYGLEYDDFAWILRDDRTNAKGFWRVDKDKPPELRHTTLALAAFKRLKEVGFAAFCQEDWQFPPEVAERLGPRFTAWQQEGSVGESWAECEGHAARMQIDGLVSPGPVMPGERIAGNNAAYDERSDGAGSRIGEKAEAWQLDLWDSDARA